MTSHELRFPLGSAFPPVWFSHEMCVPGVYVEQELCLTTSYAFTRVMTSQKQCLPNRYDFQYFCIARSYALPQVMPLLSLCIPMNNVSLGDAVFRKSCLAREYVCTSGTMPFNEA